MAVCHKLPYYAPVVMALRLVETRDIPTMAVDSHGRCYYNPDTVDRWTTDQTAAVLLHEASHILRLHHQRAGDIGIVQQGDASRVWNVAADMEINDDLHAFPLPPGALLPGTFGLPHGKLAEWYFGELSKSGDGTGPDGTGASSSGPPSPGGSSADGIARPYELPADDPDAPGLTAAEQRMIARLVAQEVLAHSRGDIPAGIRRWADSVLMPPVVPWWKELRASLRKAVAHAAGNTDYTWGRLARREPIDPDILLPAMHRPVVTVAVVIDTSGSMSDGLGARCLSELGAIIRSSGVAVDVVACDAAAAVSRKVLSPKRAVMLGGGGTDMGIGIRNAERLRPHPSVIVTLTDGKTAWPSQPPRARHIAVILSATAPGPTWGKTIRIEE